jgi:transcription elongation factor GreA
MIDNDKKAINLGDAAGRFLVGQSPGERARSQQAINHFVRWFGRGRLIGQIAVPEVANYARRASSPDREYLEKLDIIRGFLAYAKREGWTGISLATHLKARKGRVKLADSANRTLPEPVSLTRQGHDQIKQELESLRSKRPLTIDEISRAAADKDFRENAPLDAAREQLAHIDGRIRELEATLKSVVLIEGKVTAPTKVGIGDRVLLRDVASGEELFFTIVSPKEVNPARGKISSSSPLGRAVVGNGCGDVVEVTVPAGRLCYRIEEVGSGG